jgi:hypothetical protein
MKKRLTVLGLVAAMFALPLTLEAATVCAVNSFGQFFRFQVRDRCTAAKDTISSINGRWHPGGVCNTSDRVPLHGTCTGDPATGQVVLSITTETSNPCLQVMWLLGGPSIDTAVGVFDNAPFNGGDAGDSFAPASCASEPLAGELSEPVGPGPVPGRQ